jgi:hypothetical protein
MLRGAGWLFGRYVLASYTHTHTHTHTHAFDLIDTDKMGMASLQVDCTMLLLSVGMVWRQSRHNETDTDNSLDGDKRQTTGDGFYCICCVCIYEICRRRSAVPRCHADACYRIRYTTKSDTVKVRNGIQQSDRYILARRCRYCLMPTAARNLLSESPAKVSCFTYRVREQGPSDPAVP